MPSHLLGKQFSLGQLLLLCLALSSFILAGLVHQNVKKPLITISKQETALNLNHDILVFLSAGNKRMLADLLWIQTLIESDIEHYTKADMENWMYLRFKSIASLDPFFYQNYQWGGQYLSIVKDDLQGAVAILDEGLKYFPNDYHLNYLAGFTYYYELGNYAKGIYHLEKIEDHPRAPHYLKTLVNKMKIERGFNFDTIMELILNQIHETSDEYLKNKLTDDFYSIKAERDLKCLISQKSHCDLKDAEGTPYIQKGGKYYSSKSFAPYRLRKKGDLSKTLKVNTIEVE